MNVYAPFMSALFPVPDTGTPGRSKTIVFPPGVESVIFKSPTQVCSRLGAIVPVPKFSVTDNLFAAFKIIPLLTAMVLLTPPGVLSSIARLMVPDENEREGYVPNVIYSCGSIIHNEDLILPYAMSDHSSSYVTIDLRELLDVLKASGNNK